MPDEIGTEAARSDAPSADDALDNAAVEAAQSEDPKGRKAQKVPDGEKSDANEGAAHEPQGSDDAGDKPDAEAKADAPEDLKVVVSIKGGRATIGVQRPSSDPHIESFDDADLSGLAQEVTAVTERAKARWEETPKHPVYDRPAPPARRGNRRRQGAAQASTAEGETERERALTPRLF